MGIEISRDRKAGLITDELTSKGITLQFDFIQQNPFQRIIVPENVPGTTGMYIAQVFRQYGVQLYDFRGKVMEYSPSGLYVSLQDYELFETRNDENTVETTDAGVPEHIEA